MILDVLVAFLASAAVVFVPALGLVWLIDVLVQRSRVAAYTPRHGRRGAT